MTTHGDRAGHPSSRPGPAAEDGETGTGAASTPPTWPPGDGEMARRIRAHDWAHTPLGPVEGWPQSLRTAVDMVLAMPGPATILWGPAGVQLYNDAYIAIAQDRHPALLGRPVAEGWPDVYEAVILPLLEAARAGRSTRLTDYLVALRHPDGRIEERVFDTDWLPVRDEAGTVAGFLQTLTEITERQRAERSLRESDKRQAFLLKLSDALRAEPDADSMAARALSLLYQHLELDRTYIAKIRGAENPVEIVAELGRDDLTPMPTQLEPADFPEGFQKAAEGLLVVDNIWERPDLSELDRQSLDAIALTSFVVAPLHRGAEGMIWAMVAGARRPRTWTSHEATLIQETAERTWGAMERAGAASALGASEEKYRSLFETMSQGYVELELLRDGNGRVVDQLYLELNPAFERLFGTPAAQAVGRKASELFPDLEPWWNDAFDRVSRSGNPERLEHAVASLDRWFEVFAYPRGGGRVAALYDEVTQRKRDELAVRESEARLAFLLALTDALRPLTVTCPRRSGPPDMRVRRHYGGGWDGTQAPQAGGDCYQAAAS